MRHRQTDRQTDRKTEKEPETEIERGTHSQVDIETRTHRHRGRQTYIIDQEGEYKRNNIIAGMGYQLIGIIRYLI